jgi:Tol biopolymer transport system component
VALIAGVAWLARHRSRPAPELKQQQLTALTFTESRGLNSVGYVEFGSISPDGKNVAYASKGGLRVRGVDSGESAPIALPAGFAFSGPFPITQWFPDGTRLVVSGQMDDGTPAVWVLPTVGGRPHKISSDGAMATVSPDGKHVAFIRSGKRGPEIWCADPDGRAARHVASTDSTETIISWAAWSPRGQRLVYTCQSVDRSRGSVTHMESCDLDGNARPVGDAQDVESFPLWLPDGRVVFSLTDPAPNQSGMNLWSLRVDPSSGVSSGRPRRITQWQRIALLMPLGVSTDGRRLTVGLMKWQSDCYLGRVAGGDSALQDVKRLTNDDRMDLGPAWTPDSRAIVFMSDRNSNLDVFEQAIGETEAQPLVTGPADQTALSVTGDGAWLLYKDYGAAANPGTSVRVMRLPLGSGPAEVVMARADSIWVMSEMETGQMVLKRFDPLRGRGPTLGTLQAGVESYWDLSPDGTRAAVVGRDSIPRIRVLSFEDRTVHEVRLDRRVVLVSVSWAPDGRSWYVLSAGEEGVGPWYVLRVMPNGRTIAITPPQVWMYSCAASPDGRHVVYTSNTGDASLWLLEDF